MLKKLLKYDLKWTYKILNIIYVLSIIFAIITRLLIELNSPTSILKDIIKSSLALKITLEITRGIAITILINIMVNTIIRIILRFKNNLFSDEAYLTHTLPIPKQTIYLSKVLNAIIISLTSIFVIIISLTIMYYSKENIEIIKNTLSITASIYNSTVIRLILVLFLVVFTQLTLIIMIVYSAILLGYSKSDKRIIKSVTCGIISYLITQILVLLIVYIIGLFDPSIMQVFTSNTVKDITILKKLMYIIITIYLLFNIIYYYIGQRILKQGINID